MLLARLEAGGRGCWLTRGKYYKNTSLEEPYHGIFFLLIHNKFNFFFKICLNSTLAVLRGMKDFALLISKPRQM